MSDVNRDTSDRPRSMTDTEKCQIDSFRGDSFALVEILADRGVYDCGDGPWWISVEGQDYCKDKVENARAITAARLPMQDPDYAKYRWGD